MSKYDEIEFKPNNRVRCQEPRSGYYWCGTCDRNKVAANTKCSYCGKKVKEKNFKK